MPDIMPPKRMAVEGSVMIAQHHYTGMITIRADLSDAKVKAKIKSLTGHAVPKQRRINGGQTDGLAWMSPDELLYFCPSDVAETVAKLEAGIGGHAMVVDVSHSRAVFSIAGTGTREVLAKGAPIDLSPEGFGKGDYRRTRIGQVAAAFWLEDVTSQTFAIVCFSSVAEYMFDWLSNAASKGSLPEYL